MADATRLALTELRRKADAAPSVDVLREGVRVLAEAVTELASAQHVSAQRTTCTLNAR